MALRVGLIFLLTIFLGCGDAEEQAELTVTFKLTYGDSPLAAFENREYPRGYEVFFTKFSLYLSNISLVSEDDPIVLSEVEFIDLLTGINDQTAAEKGLSRQFSNIPTGEYSELRLNVGVTNATNQLTPADFAPDHPLGNTAEYWVGWSSYIFQKIEGKYDEDGDGEPETNIALHMGSDEAFREIVIRTPVRITADPNHLEITFDLEQILFISGEYFSFEELSQIHNLSQLPEALPIVDNLASGISVSQ